MSTIGLVMTIVSPLSFFFVIAAHVICVQIENNLNEWVTGKHVSIPFTQVAYEQKYVTHIKRSKDFEERTKDSDIMPQIRKHLLKKAR